MGPERGAIMMDLLPPVGWGDIATKRNIQAEVGGLRSEMQAGSAELRAPNPEAEAAELALTRPVS